VRADDFDYVEYEQFMSVYLTVLSKRSMRWARIMTSNPQLKKTARLKQFVRKGIPLSLRAQVGVTFDAWRFVLITKFEISFSYYPGVDVN
jgi:hypothetical protein